MFTDDIACHSLRYKWQQSLDQHASIPCVASLPSREKKHKGHTFDQPFTACSLLLRLHLCKQQTRCAQAVYQHCLPHMIDVHRVRTSVPKDRCVMATSSTRMLNSLALFVKLSRICGCDNGYRLIANGCDCKWL